VELPMNIDIEELAPGVTLIRLTGRLDTPGVDVVEARFSAASISQDKHTLVDLSQVSFIASMGIRMLIATARAMKQRQRKIVLFAAQPLVQETLQTMSVDTLMALVPDLDTARGIVAG
jgi:anti-sigma B factor antagonist